MADLATGLLALSSAYAGWWWGRVYEQRRRSRRAERKLKAILGALSAPCSCPSCREGLH